MNLRTFLKLGVLILMAATVAQARLGETKAVIEGRYGVGRPDADARLAGTDRYHYQNDTFDIEAIYLKGISVMEVYHRKEKKITDDDIKGILKANGDGHSWALDKKTNEWQRADRKLKAFRAPGHDDFLFVQDVAVVKEIDKKNKRDGGI